MTTLHGSTPFPWRRAEGCVPLEGTITSAMDPLTHPFYLVEPPQPWEVPYAKTELRSLGSFPRIRELTYSQFSNRCCTENFGSLVRALYGIEEGIAKGLWPKSSPTDYKGKKTSRGQRLRDDTTVLFTLWPEDDDSRGREIQIVTLSGRIVPPPPLAVKPFEDVASHEEVKRDDDEIRVETTTTPEGLIHIITTSKATCIVFSDDDLSPDGLDHVRLLYITVGCSCHRVLSVLLDNGSTLNVCLLTTAITLGFAPSDFDPSTQTVKEYDSTKMELQLSYGAPGTSVSMAIAPPSLDRASLLSLCFPKEVIDEGVVVNTTEMIDGVVLHDEYRDEMDMITMIQISNIVQLQSVSPFNMFGLSTIEVKEEIQKQLSVGFISVVEYPEWLANVIHVPKKDGKVRLCVDFKDLNKASLKNDFPLPHIDFLVDSTSGHSMLTSWMGFQGKANHLEALERFFERIQNFRLRLNPKKCTFGVTSRKLLGHMVRERGIEVNPDKIKAILDMLVSKTKKDIRDMTLGCMLAQLDDLGREKLRHYMTKILMHLISRLDLLRYLFDRPILTSRLMKWLILLTKFNIQYVSQKSIKGSIVADHLASLPTSEDRPVDDDFLDEEFIAMTSLSGWRMYFDGATNQSGYGIVEYEACILGLEIVLELGIRQIEIQGDWKTRDVKLRSYHAYLELLVARFDDLRYVHLPRLQNQFANTLATLASSMDIPIDVVVHPLLIELRSAPAYCCLIGEIEFLRSGTYPKVAIVKDQRALRQLATRFMICGDTLYRQSADVWGIDIIGKISPKYSNGHEFILVAIDYLTKWVEAASYARLTSTKVASFIRSSAYRPHTNGIVEIANKNIKRILRKLVETSRDWLKKLPFALWAYCTSFCISTGTTPYFLVYGMEAILPVKTEMDSLRVVLEQWISEIEWARARFDQLNLLDERRLRAADHVQAYQRKMARAFRKRVKLRPLQKWGFGFEDSQRFSWRP
uniref:RNase H type-1 domain-containing protein n=1 Tax=Vitis vinifera TaxID=29760 RepID=A5B8X7_VITVI|nr:hypothetical protein VITISV_001719 [Vitis vinifera]